MTQVLFQNLLPWWAWASVLAVPPLVLLLYFLKLKRKPVEVPSTFLWRKSIEDLHVNSLLQRLRRNLLLFLQLLLLLLALIALTGPYWQGEQLAGQRFAVLLDRSASMQATDTPDGLTRFEIARGRARQLIEALPTGAEAMILAFAEDAELVQGWTSDRSELLRRLERLEPTYRGTSLETAWQQLAAASMTRVGDAVDDPEEATRIIPVTAYLISDGQFPTPESALPQDVTVRMVPVGRPETDNVAITALSVGRNEQRPDEQQVFVRVGHFAGSESADTDGRVEAVLELWFGGRRLDAKAIAIPKNGATAEAFDLVGAGRGVLEARVLIDDALDLDNTAYLTLNPPRRGRTLLVTPGNEPLETALATQGAQAMTQAIIQRPEYLETSSYELEARGGFFDLVIFDRCAPEDMPQANTLFLGSLPPGEEWTSEGEIERPRIIAIDRSDPLLGLMQVEDVLIVRARGQLRGPSGARSLMDSQQGALMVAAPRGSFRDVVLGFPLKYPDAQDRNGTDWPIRLSYAVFVLNVFDQFGRDAQSRDEQSLPPGQTVTLRNPAGDDSVVVVDPAGAEHRIVRRGAGDYTFTATDRLGIYQVRWGSESDESFAVNLFSASESRIAQVTPDFQGTAQVESADQTQWVRFGLWKYLLAGAVILLIIEWMIYARRVAL